MPSQPRKRPARKPPGQPAARPPDDQIAPPDRVRVAAFGDSLMWGQGLRRNERFTALITAALPKEHGGKAAVVAADASRSGAKIRARGLDRQGFQETFPALFTPAQIRPFLEGKNESPATALYGEVPATFPTVRGQVDLVTPAIGKTIDVALVCGGVNDLEVEDVVNPQVATGEFIEEWDGQIRAIAHDDVLDLLARVRRKCPNAIIMYFGFFAPLSYKSDVNKIRDFFEHEYNDAFGWWFNENVFQVVDVNALIQEGMTRALWMQGRWQYWARQAVVDANRDAAVRGPGVLFIPSGFTQHNAVFATSPFLHEDYTHPTSDPAQPERERRCPRAPQLRDMTKLMLLVFGLDKDLAQKLHDAIDGPSILKSALKVALDRGLDDAARDRLLGALSREISRIQRTLIASLSHPNAAGAKSYADNAMARYRRHRALTAAIDRDARPGAPPPLPGQGETLDAKLRRYRLRGADSLHADAGHLDVDSLAVRVTTAIDSDVNLVPDVWLVVTTEQPDGGAGRSGYLLNFKYTHLEIVGNVSLLKLYPYFEPGKTNRFTIDTMGRLRLDEITGCALLLGPDPFAGRQVAGPHGTVWRPQTVRLEVNGQQVVDLNTAGRSFGPGASLDLSYPAPQPNFVPPPLAPITVATAKPLILDRFPPPPAVPAVTTGGP
jgi:GDSL-like Lipase/Acylhydrolase family